MSATTSAPDADTSANGRTDKPLFRGLTSTEISLIIAAPFILTAFVVMILILVRRAQSKRQRSKLQEEAAISRPIQLVNNVPLASQMQKPQTATLPVLKGRAKEGVDWQPAALHGNAANAKTAGSNPWANR